MAALKKIFQSAVNTAFSIFEEAVVSGIYKQPLSDDDGFSEVEYSETAFNGIITTFEQKDLESLSFGDRVQPTDLKCLIPGEYISSLTVGTQDILTVLEDYDGNALNDTYSVVAFDVDPYKILYTILLRNA